MCVWIEISLKCILARIQIEYEYRIRQIRMSWNATKFDETVQRFQLGWFYTVRLLLLLWHILLWSNHLLWFDILIELFGSENPKTESWLLQWSSLLVSLLSSLCCIIVSNVWIKSRHQHEWILHQLINSLTIRLETIQTVLSEGDTRISENAQGMKIVGNNNRLEKKKGGDGKRTDNKMRIRNEIQFLH